MNGRLQVTQVQFREVYLPPAGGEEEGAAGSFLRRCVMDVGLVNRGRWPLQVRRSLFTHCS